MKLVLPKPGLQGKYTLHVMEPASLARRRRIAGKRAGFQFPYDGSVKAYHRLSENERQAHDKILSRLISPSFEHPKIVETRESKNLILDQGLDALFTSYNLGQASTACAVGTGTTVFLTDSGAITATSAANVVTASAPIFSAGMVGQLINFDSGQQCYITVFTSSTVVTVSNSPGIVAQLFTVYAVNRTSLATEVKRSTSYLTGAGNCGTSFTGGGATMELLRTYNFSSEVSNQNYTELGWSNTGSSGANLFSGTLISGGTVTVLIGQQLRVIYTLSVTVSTSSSPGTYAITGWPVAPSVSVDGDYILPGPYTGMGQINTNGAFLGIGQEFFDMLNAAPVFPYIATGTTLPTFGNLYASGTAPAPDSQSLGSYTPGSFQRDRIYVFNSSTAVGTNWRGIGNDRSGSTNFVFVFDQDQTKDGLHTLTVNITISYGRILTNP